MNLSPKYVLEKGIIKSAKGMPPIESNQCQQVGVDLRVNKIYSIKGNSRITKDKKDRMFPNYDEVPLLDDNCYALRANTSYAVDTMEYVELPPWAFGLAIHKSTYNRVGSTVLGSVYDPGFRGVIAVTIRTTGPVQVEKGVGIAQFICMEADAASVYNGSYQDQKGGFGLTKKEE